MESAIYMTPGEVNDQTFNTSLYDKNELPGFNELNYEEIPQEYYEAEDSAFQQSEKILLPHLDLDTNYGYTGHYANELWQGGRSDSSDSSLSTPDTLKGPAQFPQGLVYNNYDIYSNSLFDYSRMPAYPQSYNEAYNDPMLPYRMPNMFPMGLNSMGPSLMGSFASKPLPQASKRYRCSMCGKGFSRPSSLTTHTYSHTGEKPFRCPVEGCGRQFSVVSNLRRHGKVHQSSS